MSTLAIDNFKPAAGGTSFGIEGIAKAYFTYDHIATTVDESYNISSITDNATGRLSFSFTNSMANSNWSVSGNAGADDADALRNFSPNSNNTAKTSSSWGARVSVPDSANLNDANQVLASMFGDLA